MAARIAVRSRATSAGVGKLGGRWLTESFSRSRRAWRADSRLVSFFRRSPQASTGRAPLSKALNYRSTVVRKLQISSSSAASSASRWARIACS